MRALLTSKVLGFRSMLSAILIVCSVYLAFTAYNMGHPRVALWLVIGTSLYVVALNYLTRKRLKNRRLRNVVDAMLICPLGIIMLVYTLITFELAFPATRGAAALEASVAVMCIVCAIGIWFSSYFQRRQVRLINFFVDEAGRQASNCVYLREGEMSHERINTVYYNIAYMVIEKWLKALFGVVSGGALVLLCIGGVTDSFVFGAAILALASQAMWLGRCLTWASGKLINVTFDFA